MLLSKGSPLAHVLTLNNQTQNVTHACHRCGLTNHKADKCKSKEVTCHACGKKGHIKRVCEARERPREKVSKCIDTDQQEQDSGDEGTSFSICYTEQASSHPIHVQLLLNGNPFDLEVDTGAAVSMLSEKQLNRVLPGRYASSWTQVY